MESTVDTGRDPILQILRMVGWGMVAIILLLPLVLGAPWTLADYLLVAILLGGAGLVMELIVRVSRDWSYRIAAALGVAACILLLLVNGAIGFLGDEDNPHNLVFLGVIAIAAFGVVLSGFRPAGMARTMYAAATAQLLIGIAAIPLGWASPGFDGVYEVALGTTMFSILWLVSATLFRRAAARGAAVAGASRP
jgi:hypothetical protein